MRMCGTVPRRVHSHSNRSLTPSARAASRGRRAKAGLIVASAGTLCVSNGSLAAKRGPHNRWRSVRSKVAERKARRREMP
jgi:hypothetical protein